MIFVVPFRACLNWKSDTRITTVKSLFNKTLTRCIRLNLVKSQGNSYLPRVLPPNQISEAASLLYNIVPLLVVLLSSLATPPSFFPSLCPDFPRMTPISSVQNRGPFCSASWPLSATSPSKRDLHGTHPWAVEELKPT